MPLKRSEEGRIDPVGGAGAVHGLARRRKLVAVVQLKIVRFRNPGLAFTHHGS
jgi:hypothetical protein